jgi:hypothetical protein
MAEVRDRVHDRLRAELRRHGASEVLSDAAIFAAVERLLRESADSAAVPGALLLPHLLGDPSTWRLETALQYQSHRPSAMASFVVGIKRHVLMPALRWLFEYSRDNFERQARVNRVLFACVQELAIQNAELRAMLRRQSPQ